ncbi:hypothetical protein HT031_000262 [Scenedesmus sp. PABB004]|nr:hypothetical protein HT031_000262 [Scenedesmus sp. PABB004]
MACLSKAGLLLVAVLAMAAVASAEYGSDGHDKDFKLPKKITIVPKVKVYTNATKGPIEPFKKPLFKLNNTIIHKAKEMPAKDHYKEEPVHDYTEKPDVWKWKPEVEFKLNNTIIHKAKVYKAKDHYKEEPVHDYTEKPDVWKWKPEVEFKLNNTIIHKAKEYKAPEFKEAPVKDITEKPDEKEWKDVDKAYKEWHDAAQKHGPPGHDGYKH